MKKTLKLIVALLTMVLLTVSLFACGNGNTSKPTEAFTAFSNYIDAHGTALSSSSNVKRLNYNNLKDDYFGTISISVYGYGNDINFYFSTSGGKLSISIYDYKSAHIHVSYKETLGNVEVSMNYSSLSSAYSGEVDYVKVSDVEQSKSSNLYSPAVSNAQRAVNAATTWMSAIVRNALGGSLTVHDLYNH